MSNNISSISVTPLETVHHGDQEVGGASRLLGPVFVADDPVSQASILLVQSFRDERSDARKTAALAEVSRVREGEARVHEMHEKADEIRKAGLVKGIATAASGALTITGGAIALGKASDSAAQKFMTLGSGSGKVFEGAGNIVGSRYDAEAIDCEANAAGHESLSEAARTAREEATAQANDAKQSAQKVTDALKEISATRNATLQAAAIRV